MIKSYNIILFQIPACLHLYDMQLHLSGILNPVVHRFRNIDAQQPTNSRHHVNPPLILSEYIRPLPPYLLLIPTTLTSSAAKTPACTAMISPMLPWNKASRSTSISVSSTRGYLNAILFAETS